MSGSSAVVNSVIGRFVEFRTTFSTLLALGLANLYRVGRYRILLRLGLHPVQSLDEISPVGPFFKDTWNPVTCEANTLLEARSEWRTDFGPYRAFGYDTASHYSLTEPPDWFRSLTTEKRAPDSLPWWTIGDFSVEVGDIKSVWELSRFDWLLDYAQQAALGKQEALDRLDSWLQNWCDRNVPYNGANWKCGQEASIRVLHLSAACLILNQCVASDALKALMRIHLKRIAPTIDYAVGQANNHGTSEAAALFIGGSLIDDRESRLWAESGRYWLENRATALIESDGTFSQYSVNYHRLMLDTYSFCEIWRRRMALPAFSSMLTNRLASATHWLRQCVDPDTGHVPNIGANDGAQILKLSRCDFRDYRPTVQLAAAVFRGCRVYEDGAWNQSLLWFGLQVPEGRSGRLDSESFDDGGLHVLRAVNAVAYLRYPRFRFRPSQADALHCDLWVKGENRLVDAGSFSYNSSIDDTHYFSGVAAHNTIQFDGREQMPRISRFLFGRWLMARDVSTVSVSASGIGAGAAYRDAYGACHHRQLLLSSDKMLVLDDVTGFSQSATLRWRLSREHWTLYGNELSGGDMKILVESDDPDMRLALVQGRSSVYYLSQHCIVVLEVTVARSSKITTSVFF